ncbi:hypothetical protein CRV15_28840 (plasmid) [Streptomyces clavuligerus]|uniref:Uncharacterized protein n=1 Tax=Streptomyces clavuligerus TaxID=1901 RepID=D5SI97_STRCL|nr:hypothetical protein [Streptomyces clavuligerus]EFG03640.1 Hypothetical protein SCLAV_p0149 [Streptomyces clavuligerus]MBY6307798.1 hypothetical protein [Streptomyces clavuligerus]QCS09652.1 hypothetical protein CRV15_28840 [Streptomyces clavuligerus]QPJ98304.1 hypothetical protein GE265_35510 [Streptomyces clavuligerus]
MAASSPAADSDPALVVPVEVDALVINDAVRTAPHEFARWKLNFYALGLNVSPEPRPFSGTDPDFATTTGNNGAYLQWRMPQALRHGTYDTLTGTTALPLVPNRWLVVRYSGPATGRSADAWVVDSDYLDRQNGTSPFLQPPAEPGAAMTVTRAGRKVNLADGSWSEPTGRGPLYLTVLGPGIDTFSVYQPYNENVFSLHDPLDGLQEQETLSYLVTGWYSDPAQDILAVTPGTSFAEILASLGWSTTTTGTTTGTTTRSLYQGMVLDLAWNSTGPAPASPRPAPDAVDIAIGTSSDDALAALAPPPADPLAVRALLRGLLPALDTPGGHGEVTDTLHEAAFSQSWSGNLWTVNHDPATTPPPPVAPDPAVITEALSELNTAQAQYDLAVTTLSALQWRLYCTWWMSTLPLLPPQYRREQFRYQLDPTADGSLAQQVSAQTDTASTLKASIPTGDTPEELAAAITTANRHYGLDQMQLTLSRAGRTASYQSGDPVILTRGAQGTQPPAPLTGTTTLPCRFPDQLITGITFREQSITAADVAAVIPAIPNSSSGLPPELPSLVDEFFFLDGFNATSIAATQGWTDSATIDDLATAMADPADNALYDSADGAPPPYGTTVWSQPWTPLYLMWKADYYAIPFTTGTTPDWTFNGTDYQWNGTGAATAPRTYLGRSILTPQLTSTLAHQLTAYADRTTDPDTATALTRLAAQATEGDLLSQTMDGLTEQFALRVPQPGTNPPPALAPLIGQGYHYGLNPGPLPEPFTGWSPSGFQQLRSGQFTLTGLQIIDRFGRVLDLTPATSGATFTTAPDLTATASAVDGVPPALMVQLSPRLLQPARLTADTGTGTAHTARATAAEPTGDDTLLIGWVISNYADRALMIYSPAGDALGELLTTSAGVTWTPLPYTPYPTLDSLATDHPHLHNVLAPLTGPDPAAFTDLRTVIDTALAVINPTGGTDDQRLATLIGRPLALLRSRLTIELDGPPVTDPGWQYAFTPATPEFTTYPWNIRLGRDDRPTDGLVGYYRDDTYTTLFTDYLTAPTGYLTPITGNWPTLTADPTTTGLNLTLLTDPRNPVHVTTGILPTTAFQIPADLIQAALQRMNIPFRADPLLAPEQPPSDAGPQTGAVVLPRPIDKTQNWSWAQPTTAPAQNPPLTWTTYPTAPADTTAHLPGTPPVLRAGMLQLDQPLTPPPDQAPR